MSCNIHKALVWETLSTSQKLDRYLVARDLDVGARIKAHKLARDPSVIAAVMAARDMGEALTTLALAFNVPREALANVFNQKRGIV